jgi:hypothetical protein
MSVTFSRPISTSASLAAWTITLAVSSQLRQPLPSTLNVFMSPPQAIRLKPRPTGVKATAAPRWRTTPAWGGG